MQAQQKRGMVASHVEAGPAKQTIGTHHVLRSIPLDVDVFSTEVAIRWTWWAVAERRPTGETKRRWTGVSVARRVAARRLMNESGWKRLYTSPYGVLSADQQSTWSGQSTWRLARWVPWIAGGLWLSCIWWPVGEWHLLKCYGWGWTGWTGVAEFRT